MPRPLPPDHPTFGPCVTVRRRGAGDWGLMIILSVLLATFGSLILFASISGALKGDRSALIGIPFGLGFLLLILPCIFYLLTRFEFYHQGAAIRRGSKSREYPYTGATHLEYSLTRQYYNGLYVGTAQKLTFKTADSRKFRFAGTHKEKPRGLRVLGLTREFKGEDELDVIRAIIAAEVAQSYSATLSAGQPVNWCKEAQLTSNGIIPLRGKRKGQIISWSDLAGVSADKGQYHIFAKGDKLSFANFLINTPNFYPGLELFTALASAHLPQLEPSLSPTADSPATPPEH